ncbi:MAG: FHA domain-containing protein, partial [Roseobacter sp.]|nr:FHA domain-containing protein [Roseobacter sp.]
TRLLGFSAAAIENSDPFGKEPTAPSNFPVGWLVVVSQMGRGTSFALQEGVTRVGRGTDQTVCLNFGDNSISRDNHLSIAFDAEQGKFFIGHSGKTNLVRLNNKPLLSTEELKTKDLIRLGETTLRFIAFCADDFSWNSENARLTQHA